MKKKLHELERMSSIERRRFLKYMGLALGAPLVPAALRHAANAIAGGTAYADQREAELPRYFIEINLRDQWDHGHLMVPPGLATNSGLRRGTSGTQAALFTAADELSQHDVNGTTVFLSNESRALQDHLDHRRGRIDSHDGEHDGAGLGQRGPARRIDRQCAEQHAHQDARHHRRQRRLKNSFHPASFAAIGRGPCQQRASTPCQHAPISTHEPRPPGNFRLC